jgi:predicted NUDIX family phosphoesterase
MAEKVLVIPSALVDKQQMIGNIWLDTAPFLRLIGHKSTKFMDRKQAEDDTSFRQPIPYIVVMKGGKIFLTTRAKKSGDQRLRGKSSIGVGGHINKDDYRPSLNAAPKGEAFLRGTAREVREELSISGIDGPAAVRFVAIIKDDSTEVGMVHLGFIGVINLPVKARVSVTGDGLLDGRFVSPQDLSGNDLNPLLESWSQIIVKNMDAFMSASAALSEFEADLFV